VIDKIIVTVEGAAEAVGTTALDVAAGVGAAALYLVSPQGGDHREADAEKKLVESEKEHAAEPEAASGGKGVRGGKKDRSLEGNVDQLEGVQHAQQQTNKSSKGQYGLDTKKSQQNIDNANKKIKSLEDVENQ
jgi:hypothetical protein